MGPVLCGRSRVRTIRHDSIQCIQKYLGNTEQVTVTGRNSTSIDIDRISIGKRRRRDPVPFMRVAVLLWLGLADRSQSTYHLISLSAAEVHEPRHDLGVEQRSQRLKRDEQRSQRHDHESETAKTENPLQSEFHSKSTLIPSKRGQGSGSGTITGTSMRSTWHGSVAPISP